MTKNDRPLCSLNKGANHHAEEVFLTDVVSLCGLDLF